MVNKFIDEVKRVIESSLPASSAMGARVIQVIIDQSSNARDVAEIIEHDPSLTINILKIANSAYYGSSTTIYSIKRAVVVLGFDTIKELISTVSFVSCFKKDKNSFGDDITGLWYHSVGTAKACQFISKKTFVERPDLAYIAGLLHDIGKIMLALYFPEHFKNVIELAAEKKTRIILAEHKILNTNHTMIGNLLCDLWALPENISTAILHHHDPTGCEKDSQKLARIIELGDYMCRKAQIGFPGDEKTIQPSHATMDLLGSRPDLIENNFKWILDKLNESKYEIEEFFRELESN